MARVYTQTTRKERQCGRCGDPIHKGDTYHSAAPGWRGPTLIRCTKSECRFRQSDLVTSNMRDAYAAVETAEDDLNAISIDETEAGDTVLEDEIQPILETCAEGIRESAQLYRDASENWGDGRGNEEWDERADTLESAADEVEQIQVDPYDEGEWDSWDDYLESTKSNVVEEVTGVSLE